MKAVILAAGLGSRIRSATSGLPKCLLRFDDQTILDCQIESLFDAGISALTVVVGHGKEHIVDHVAERHPEKCDSISFIVNPKFATTNNIYSLWLTRQWVAGSDFICLNADVLYDRRIIVPAVATRADISMIVDEEFREETMKVIIRGGRVLAMGKRISRENASGTYIGITTFSRRVSRSFFAAMAEVLEEGLTNVFFNAAVERLIARGMPVHFTRTAGLAWTEVDDAQDLEYAHRMVYPQMRSQDKSSSTFPSESMRVFSPSAV